MIRSLGLASDAMLLEGISELEIKGDHIVWRSPSEPTFWYGNCVVFSDCPDDPRPQIAAFEAAFPDARHRLVVWDDPEMVPGAGHEALRGLGYEIEVCDVLTLSRDLTRPPTPEGFEIRAVRSGADWAKVVDLQVETGVADGHDPGAHRPFVEGRFRAIREQCEAGRSCWFGAWDGPVLAGDLGIMFDERVARYRSVETRPAYRRRGICPALLCAAHDWALARSPSAVPVIVAMADSDAGRIYRRCGFAVAETNVSAVLKGY